MPITIKDIAQKAGVSIKTVSRVINNEQNVAETTRNNVLLVIDDLGYVPNLSAQRLARGSSGLIGLILGNATASYIMTVINGLLDYGDLHNFRVSLHRVDTNKPHQVQNVIGRALQNGVEGFIITPPCDNAEKIIETFRNTNFPFIILSPRDRNQNYSWVTSNDYKGSMEATKYLLELGHKSIGFIQGNSDHQASWDRFQGFKKAMDQAGLTPEVEYCRQGDWTAQSGYEQGTKLLSLKKRPTAILTSNDQCASGVIQAAWKLGINCPEQLSVIGYDDVPLAQQLTPPLTTVRQPIYEIATHAVSILIEHLVEHPNQHITHELDTKLIVRNSTTANSQTKE
ncbi:MAG: LacI family DNA-binding transcriptional regulator [Anaerolineaceae bacterium]|nr:LacI family DNA-binding transcriptional regulator [Anaerolineaceae bacterium]